MTRSKKPKSPVEIPEDQQTEIKPPSAFALRIESVKRKLAFFLQQKTDKLSLPIKKMFLIAVGLTIAGMCIGSILNAWQRDYSDQLNVGSLVFPQMLTPTSSGDSLLSKQEFMRIMKLQYALDSLRENHLKLSDTVH